MTEDALTMDSLVEVYVALREEKRELEQAVALKVKELDEKLDLISAALLDMCKEVGADSVRTAHGTVIRSLKTKYWTNDWESMYGFIKEHDAFGLLEKRLHQSNMKIFLEENEDLHPAGLNIDKEFVITVRKK